MSSNGTSSSLNPPNDIHFFQSSSFNNLGLVTNVVGDYHYHPTPTLPAMQLRATSAIMRILLPRIYSQAMFNGDIRRDAPRCHPETRKTITKDLLTWAVDLTASAFILWLTGPLGTGKSAIAQHIAMLLHDKDPRLLAGSFFFWRNDGGRNNLELFISTLAYQLSLAIPEVGQVIEERIGRDPSILSRTIDFQWKYLIVEPIQVAHLGPPKARSMFIIDGLDECGTHDDQRVVLNLISSFPRALPICFLVTSRPEAPIKSRIEAICESHSSHFRQPHLVLTEDKESKEDMYLILTTAFSEVVTERKDILGNQAWPPLGAVERIIDLADGQFVYALTVVRFVTADNGNPVSRLNAILSKSSPFKSEALYPLDILYTTILSTTVTSPIDFDSPPLLLAYLSLISYSWPRNDFSFSASVSTLSQIWDKRTSEVRLELRPLHSVLRVPTGETEEIDVYHTSFREYLHDHSRSNSYVVLGPNSPIMVSVLIRCLHLAHSATVNSRFRPDVGSLWLRLPIESLHIFPGSKLYHALLQVLQEFDVERWIREYYLLTGELSDSVLQKYHLFWTWLSDVLLEKDRERLRQRHPPDAIENWFQRWKRDNRNRSPPLPPQQTHLLFQLKLAELISHEIGDSVFDQSSERRDYLSFLMKLAPDYILTRYPHTSTRLGKSGLASNLSPLTYKRFTDNLLWSTCHQHEDHINISYSYRLSTESAKLGLPSSFLTLVALHGASMAVCAYIEADPAEYHIQMINPLIYQAWAFFLKGATHTKEDLDSSPLGLHAQNLLLDVMQLISILPVQDCIDHSNIIMGFLDAYKINAPQFLYQQWHNFSSENHNPNHLLLSATDRDSIADQLRDEKALLFEKLKEHAEPWLYMVQPEQSGISLLGWNYISYYTGLITNKSFRQWFKEIIFRK